MTVLIYGGVVALGADPVCRRGGDVVDVEARGGQYGPLAGSVSRSGFYAFVAQSRVWRCEPGNGMAMFEKNGIRRVLSVRLRWTRVDTVILVIIVVLGFVLVTGLVIDRLTSETRNYAREWERYTHGVIEGERSAVEAHICPQVWEQILELSGGFGEARVMTLDALPGTIERLNRRRGSAEYSVFDIHATSGVSVLHELGVIWVDGDPQFCPDAPERLLGLPRRS